MERLVLVGLCSDLAYDSFSSPPPNFMRNPDLDRRLFSIFFDPTFLPLPRQLRKFFFTRIRQVIIALIFSIVSASGDEIRPENTQKPSSSSEKPLSVTKQKAKEETSKSLFKQRLEAAYKRYPQELYSNRNAARADYIRRKLEASDNSGTANQALIYGEELLSAGKTQEAIQILERTSKALREKGYGLDRNTKRFFDSLAMAYLRLGEDENCCAHYNEESCLFPIEGKAIHTNRRGSESAIVILKEILDSFPQDYQSRYLLNLAYMTLGEYPCHPSSLWPT